jgi:hypothetical protein
VEAKLAEKHGHLMVAEAVLSSLPRPLERLLHLARAFLRHQIAGEDQAARRLRHMFLGGSHGR